MDHSLKLDVVQRPRAPCFNGFNIKTLSVVDRYRVGKENLCKGTANAELSGNRRGIVQRRQATRVRKTIRQKASHVSN